VKAFVLIKEGAIADFEMARLSGNQIDVMGQTEILEDGKHVGWEFSPITVDEYIGGYLYIGSIGTWGAYIVHGTGAMLQELDTLPNVVGICTKKNIGATVNSTVRTKLNNWLSNNGYPDIPADWTNRQVVKSIFRRFFPDFDPRVEDVGIDDVDENIAWDD
jgi:hypothetical protein